MTRKIKLIVLAMLIILPYIYGEYSYRQHLGTIPMQCVKIWEEEHCSKGKNCHYTSHGLMLYNNGQTGRFSGNYTVGSWYVDEAKWGFLDHSINKEPSVLGKTAQIYRFFANLIMIFFGAIIAFMMSISTFVWLAFKTRFKNPLSFWIYVLGTELGSTDYENKKFMDGEPYWFYKEER